MDLTTEEQQMQKNSLLGNIAKVPLIHDETLKLEIQ